MLVCLQFPISDLRRFLDYPTGLLSVPSWPYPDHQKDFVRSFGPIRRRPLGGIPGWAQESRICEAHKSLRFAQIYNSGPANFPFPFKCVFRRFYFDGLAVGKYEIGFVIKISIFNSKLLKKALQYLLSLPVKIENQKQYVPLGNAGKLLSEYYLKCTTSTSFDNNKIANWWINNGSPILLIESKTKNLNEQRIVFDGFDTIYNYKHQLGLYHLWFYSGQHKINTWFLRIFNEKNDEISKTNYKRNRTFRQYLLRLDAEQECLLKALGAFDKKFISTKRNSTGYNYFQEYLRNAIRRLESGNTNIENNYGEEIAKLAKEAWDFADPGEREGLLYRLKLIRPQVYKKAEKLVEGLMKPDLLYM